MGASLLALAKSIYYNVYLSTNSRWLCLLLPQKKSVGGWSYHYASRYIKCCCKLIAIFKKMSIKNCNVCGS